MAPSHVESGPPISTEKGTLVGIHGSIATYQEMMEDAVVADDSQGRGALSLTTRGSEDKLQTEESTHGGSSVGKGMEERDLSTEEPAKQRDRHLHHHHHGMTQEQASTPSAIPHAPRVSSISPTVSQGPRHSSFSTGQVAEKTRKEIVEEESGSSFSDASSGSSAGSSTSSGLYSYGSDEGGGLVEDFTAEVGSWLEDVHGAGRDAFFGLFKQDVTPQFSRPALDLLGRRVSAGQKNENPTKPT